MKTFYKLLINTAAANVINNFLWFALVFWAYLETQSVLATSIIGGSYMLCSAFFGLFFGTFVDRHSKKRAMLVSSLISLAAFSLAGALYTQVPRSELLEIGTATFWSFVIIVLVGAVAGNLRNIALSTTVTLLVPEKRRAKANGMVGTAMGLSFTITSVFSGLAIGQLGMGWTLAISIAITAAILLHLLTIAIAEKPAGIDETEDASGGHLDIKGALRAIHAVPGLMALLFFATFNNFLGGVFMSLMDAYGLNLVSVEAWGILWGIVSCGFILGGILVATKGLGRSPLRTLLLINVLTWTITILFPVRSSIVLLVIAMIIYMTTMPIAEAAEQTVIQKVVPYKSQGRVFGFGQMIENAASPITAFLIGPIAQLWVIPFMTDGAGARSIGSWFGTGPDRGMALIFMGAALIGLVVTLFALQSRAYHLLTARYGQDDDGPSTVPTTPLAGGVK